jgi:acyl carrier protein
MTDDGAVRDSVVRFLERKFGVHPASLDQDLLAAGMLDSLGIVELLLFAEQDHGAALDLETLDLEDLRSVASISRLIAGAHRERPAA